MSTGTKIFTVVAAVILVGALLGGCEDTNVTVPTDSVIELSANPGTVRFDPNVDPPGTDTKTSVITAFVFDTDNHPSQGVTVSFDSNAEQPMSPTSAVTDVNGSATSTLTVTDLDGPEIQVTARSGVVTGNVSVVVDVVGRNQPPLAQATIIPLMQGEVGKVVTFDGSGSTDPDGNITCYQWRFLSDNPDAGAPNPEIIQGPGASGVQKTFLSEQTLAVSLRVSDRTDIECPLVDASNPGTPWEDEFQAGNSDGFFTNYSIVCRNTAPTAIIAGGDEITAPGTASTLTSIYLDGSLSSDPETGIDRYVWTCGNNEAPIPFSPDGSVVICRYHLGTFTATLNVLDQGTGEIDPGTGTWACQKSSATDTVTIHVEAPAQ